MGVLSPSSSPICQVGLIFAWAELSGEVQGKAVNLGGGVVAMKKPSSCLAVVFAISVDISQLYPLINP